MKRLTAWQSKPINKLKADKLAKALYEVLAWNAADLLLFDDSSPGMATLKKRAKLLTTALKEYENS